MATLIYGLICAPLAFAGALVNFIWFNDTVADTVYFFIAGGSWGYVFVCFLVSAINR